LCRSASINYVQVDLVEASREQKIKDTSTRTSEQNSFSNQAPHIPLNIRAASNRRTRKEKSYTCKTDSCYSQTGNFCLQIARLTILRSSCSSLHQSLCLGYTWSVDELHLQKKTYGSPQAALRTSLRTNRPLLFTASSLSGDGRWDIVLQVLIVVSVTSLVLRGRNPKTRLSVIKGLILVREIDTLLVVTGGVLATLGKGARTGRELRGHGSVLDNPIGEGIFAVLDDTVSRISDFLCYA
jgi:hypothetical protein